MKDIRKRKEGREREEILRQEERERRDITAMVRRVIICVDVELREFSIRLHETDCLTTHTRWIFYLLQYNIVSNGYAEIIKQ